MNHFTIKDIENLSGIKAHTLRIWEKRYGIIVPKRKESKRRFYDNEDLKHVLRITHLYNNGHKISAIANMHKDELKAYEISHGNSEFGYIKVLLEATLDLNEQLFVEAFDKAISSFGMQDCMLKIIYPYFEKIGMLWMNNETLPAQERFASNIILKKIILETGKLDSTNYKKDSEIILFTPPHEYHEIPLLFMHYLLKKSGSKVYYLGTDVTVDVLEAFTKVNPTYNLYFHVITNLTHAKIDNYLKELTEKFSDKKIIMSGRLTATVSLKANNLHLLHSLKEMMAFGNGNF